MKSRAEKQSQKKVASGRKKIHRCANVRRKKLHPCEMLEESRHAVFFQ